MKSYLKIFVLSIVLISFFSSCETDGTTGGGTGGGGVVIPDEISLTLSNDAGFVSSAATVDAGQTFAVRLVAEKGEDDLQAITITENGANLDISRFEASNTTVGANPFTIDASEVASFTKDITIVSPVDAGEYLYTFILRDVAGNTDSESVTITVNTTPPSISFMGSGMIMADLGTLVNVPIMATAGSSPLSQIAVYSNGDLVPSDELFYDDLSVPFPTNPALIPDSDKQMLDRSIFIRANQVGESVYTVEVTDEAGEVVSTDVTVTTGTQVTMIEGALLNSAGPMGTGGLDLDTGASVASNSASAHLKDEGIDTDLAMDVNWLQQISGANGSEIRALIKGENGLGENYSFEGVGVSEQIEALWSNGSALTLTNDGGDLVTSQLAGGENFVVLNNGNYYLISIREVRITFADNNDQYVIDIKK